MEPDPELKALELRLLSVIEKRDTIIHNALDKVNLRLEQNQDKIESLVERLRKLEEMVTKFEGKFENLDSRKLDQLDDREVKSREETALIFDQFLLDQEKLIPQAGDSGDSVELDARLNLIAARLAEIERIVRTQIR